MEDSTRVDLQQLKDRLAKLGVHIDEPVRLPDTVLGHPEQQQRASSSAVVCAVQEQAEPSWEPLVESNVDRHSKTLTQLLGRCTRVQHAIDRAEDGDSAAAADRRHIGRAGQQKATAISSQTRGAGQLRPLSSSRHRHASPGAARGSSEDTAAAAQADSKLLVRAARQLLEDAEEDAQQVSRSFKTAAAPAKRAAGAAASSGAGARRSTAATVAAVASVDDLRNSPLGTVLAQYKEAQAAWAQEKAKLRREAVAARKEASALRLELAKVSRSSEHRVQEASCLKAALKGRDVLLEEMQGRVKQLEDELARCQEVAAERLVSVSRERDDLQALLLATLERLEGVEAVVAAADATSAAMEDKVRVLEAERLAALQTAAAARQEVSQLQEARRRLEWQSQLLEKMSKVQLQHNKRKSEALRELLASTDATAAEAVAAAAAEGEDVTSSSTVRARESCSKATAALQDLLDELLLNSSNAAGGKQ